VLQAGAAPLLAVCSTRRSDSCAQAQQFVQQATALGVRASVLGQDLSHRDINQQLGLEGGYTRAVESFMAGLDPAVQRLLAAH
jgi:arylformamidase